MAALIWLPAYLAARLAFPNGLPRLPGTIGWAVVAFAAWIAIAATIVLTFWVQQGPEDIDLENPRGAARLSAWGRRTGIA
ncbi:MAG: hypothetical protein M3O61_15535, partial [Gemmatimonadota bacterium]|nr:hypothetical protein [Gemmatimonadota bacterium]